MPSAPGSWLGRSGTSRRLNQVDLHAEAAYQELLYGVRLCGEDLEHERIPDVGHCHGGAHMRRVWRGQGMIIGAWRNTVRVLGCAGCMLCILSMNPADFQTATHHGRRER